VECDFLTKEFFTKSASLRLLKAFTAIATILENSRRYLQLLIDHLYQRHSHTGVKKRINFLLLMTSGVIVTINSMVALTNTNGKFSAGVSRIRYGTYVIIRDCCFRKEPKIKKSYDSVPLKYPGAPLTIE
jgi:hypothetical protein